MIDPYKDKIWSTNGKNSYFDFLFLKKITFVSCDFRNKEENFINNFVTACCV